VVIPSVSAWPYTPKIPPMAPNSSEPLRSLPNPTTQRDAYYRGAAVGCDLGDIVDVSS
jgi:hypothetical protein